MFRETWSIYHSNIQMSIPATTKKIQREYTQINAYSTPEKEVMRARVTYQRQVFTQQG